MQLSQPLLPNLQPHPPRRIAIDQVHPLPRNRALLDVSADRLHRARWDTLQQPPHRAARPHLHALNQQPRGRIRRRARLPRQHHIVHAYDLAPVHVNDLLVQQVALQQQIVVQLLDRLRRNLGSQPGLPGLGHGDLCHRQQCVSGLAAGAMLQHQRHDMRLVMRRIDGELMHAAQRLARSIHHTHAHQRGDTRRDGLQLAHHSP